MKIDQQQQERRQGVHAIVLQKQYQMVQKGCICVYDFRVLQPATAVTQLLKAKAST